MPCSHCARKSIACILEIIDTPPKRSSDVIEQLSSDVAKLKGSLSVMIVRRSKMINGLLQRSGLQPVQLSEVEPEFLVEEREEYEDEDEDENDDEEEDDEEEDEEDEDHEIEYVDGDMDVDAVEENKEEDEEEEGEEEEDEEEGDVDVDVDVDVEICGNTNPDDCETVTTVIENPSFSHSLSSTASFILDSIELTRLQAAELFSNYNAKFHKFIPILPDQFLYDLDQVYEESDLLFWSIIVVSLMDRDFHELNFKFLDLVRAIKLLVVTKCWYNTPRSVHTLLSLSILTTWPLPLTTSPINDGGSGISLKYLALMEDLSLQLGLHKSEFIDEFSHKTQVGISKYSSDNNKVIRERIYKYISIQANFWLTFLGFPQNKEEDYIIDKATRQQRLPMLLPLFLSETTKGSSVSRDESFINTTLKLSSIQLKMSKVFESADNSITRLYQINKSKRFLNIGMFEVILKQLSKLCASTPIYQLTIEYTKLQLYLFAFPLWINLKQI